MSAMADLCLTCGASWLCEHVADTRGLDADPTSLTEFRALMPDGMDPVWQRRRGQPLSDPYAPPPPTLAQYDTRQRLAHEWNLTGRTVWPAPGWRVQVERERVHPETQPRPGVTIHITGVFADAFEQLRAVAERVGADLAKMAEAAAPGEGYSWKPPPPLPPWVGRLDPQTLRDRWLSEPVRARGPPAKVGTNVGFFGSPAVGYW